MSPPSEDPRIRVVCDGCGEVYMERLEDDIPGAEPAYLCQKCKGGMRLKEKA